MKSNSWIKLFCFSILYLFYFGCFGQKPYIFKKWKSSYLSEQNKVVFLLDTTDSKHDKMAFLTLKIIRDNLVANDIEVNTMLFPTDSILDKNTLCLKISSLKPAQVVEYKGFQTYVYLCKRVQIEQIEPKAKPKKSISTNVSIAVDNFADNMEAFGIDFSQKLLKHFNIAMPYKEFRFNREDDKSNRN